MKLQSRIKLQAIFYSSHFNMKRGIINTCLITKLERRQLCKKWFGLLPIKVSREKLLEYAKFKKITLSNYKKIPKSLVFRLSNFCPNCLYLQCTCTISHDNYCKNCQVSYIVQKEQLNVVLQKVIGKGILSSCKICKNKTERILFNYKQSYKNKLKLIKNNVNNPLEKFKYSIQVGNCIYPPAFMWNTNSALCDMIIKLVKSNKSYDPRQKLLLNIKPDPLSFLAQGKNNCFRRILLSKKSYHSSRSVVTPAPDCKTNEIILNKKIWASMHFPRYVLAIRYPVLDTRAFSFHRIKKTWDAPVVGIPTSITEKNNLDFDGDTLNFYALSSCMSISECNHLINPKYSFVSMGEIRPNLTHDQLESMFRFFKVQKNNLYNWLLVKYMLYDSQTAFKIFENIRNGLMNLNLFFKPTVSYFEFYNILKLFLIRGYDMNEFNIIWESNNFTKKSIFNRYLLSNSNRWRKEHLHLMVKCLRGLTKIEYLQEAFHCRSTLSKSGVEMCGYTTHKLSYALPELYYDNGIVYYGTDQVAYQNLRRLYTPVYPLKLLRSLAIYSLIRARF
jgi:hypothetical protein